MQLSLIHTDLAKMQQQLQICNDIYNRYLGKIPPRLSGNITDMKTSVEQIRSSLQSTNIKDEQKKLLDLRKQIDAISQQLNKYSKIQNDRAENDLISKSFSSIKEKVQAENRTLFEELKSQVSNHIQNRPSEIEVPEQHEFKLESSFSPKVDEEIIQFSTKPDEYQSPNTQLGILDSINRRIEDLQQRVVIIEERESKKNNTETGVAISDSVFEQHARFSKFKSDLNALQKKKVKKAHDLVKKPISGKKRPVTQAEFDENSENVSELLSSALTEIECLKSTGNQQLAELETRINAVEQKADDFNSTVKNLNEMVSSLGNKVEVVQDKEDAVSEQHAREAYQEELRPIVMDFRTQLIDARNSLKHDIATMRAKLEEIEKSIPPEFSF